jgi:hypothetical protein
MRHHGMGLAAAQQSGQVEVHANHAQLLLADAMSAITAPRGSSVGSSSGRQAVIAADLRTRIALPCQPMPPGRTSNSTGR